MQKKDISPLTRQQLTRQHKLRYIKDGTPGFARKHYRGKLRYYDHAGEILKDADHLDRIRALSIPPAWENVWICPIAEGHLQATGRDAKGRKQYIYHAQWRNMRETVKYEHMIDFGLHLPVIRQRVETDLGRTGVTRDKVLATVVYLLENTMMRIGNDRYARINKSFGLTTLRNRHVDIHGNEVKFHFRGKSGVEHALSLHDRRLARIIRKIMELPGHTLFQYLDEQGQRHAIDSGDVNSYLQDITGRDYTAKDFRTWSGTLHTMLELSALQSFETESEAKKNIVAAIRVAAEKLGNTPAICRKSYVHPMILEQYLSGALFDQFDQIEQGDDKERNLEAAECFMLKLLQKQVRL